MDFKIVAEYFDRLEKISSRIQLTNLLSELFLKTDKQHVDKIIYIIQGKLWPDFLGMPELGIGERFIIKAVEAATGISESSIDKRLNEVGDLGEVVAELKGKVDSKSLSTFLGINQNSLTVEMVYDTLTRIATMTGERSRDLKIKLLTGLIKQSSPLEAKYIVRFVEGKLRVGIGDSTIIDAMALAYTGEQQNSEIIERAYNLRADLGTIAKILVKDGIEAIKNVKPEPGIPIRPMLAERLSEPSEIITKVNGRALVDYKYDGERGQIHRREGKTFIYSRRLENISSQYPDVVEYINKSVKANNFIIEGEIVAIDPESQEMRPFQELMHRKRKNDIHSAVKEYPVKVFLFDLMFLNDEDYTVKGQLERRKALEGIVEQNENVTIANSVIVSNVTELERFFYQAINEGAEGVMVKSISEDSKYQAGARGWQWIKLKRDYRNEMADTLDLVAVGAFYGRGKRGGIYSSVLAAAYNPHKDVFEALCKVASGFSEDDLAELQKRILQWRRENKHPRVESKLEPDIWLEPAVLMEIRGAELTLSLNHPCCSDVFKKDVGLSVRFPRFIRWRDDKSPEDATTTDEIIEMYNNSRMEIKSESSEEAT
ncbi:ATP-dependent DNA ligase [Sulfolobales archaeon HS-7]|nr:ATP-dependent DNA ligase [Sulfolobales archaeon HS-7]